MQLLKNEVAWSGFWSTTDPDTTKKGCNNLPLTTQSALTNQEHKETPTLEN